MIPAALVIIAVLMVSEGLVLLGAQYLAHRQERAFWERQRQTVELYDWAKELDL